MLRSGRVGGVVVGGEYSLLASAEYMFPITANDMVRGVVFCDTGAVQPTIDNWQDRYRVAPGFGLRNVNSGLTACAPPPPRSPCSPPAPPPPPGPSA